MGIYLKDVSLLRSPKTPWETKVLQNINLQLQTGEAVGLMGSSGAGKSSLLKVIAGLFPPSKGAYENELGNPLGLVVQEPHRGFFAASVWEEVAYGPESMSISEDEVKRRTKTALQKVGIQVDLWGRSPFRLSGGEQRRVALASVLSLEPKALLLDEPNIGMDLFGRETLQNLIKEERTQQEHLVVIASHDPELLFQLTDRIILLHKGRIIFDTAWSAWREIKEILEQYGAQLPVGLQVVANLMERGVLEDREIGSPEAVVSGLKQVWGEKCRHGRI